MKIKMAWCALAAMVAAPMVVPTTAAHADYWRNGHHYRGSSHNYRHKCGGGNGAVGTVAGGVGGAVIGSALGGTAATVLGGVGGALLGRHLDKKHSRHRNGC